MAGRRSTSRIKPEATPHCHPTAALLGRSRCWLQLAAARLLTAARSLWPLLAAPNSCRLRASTLGVSLQVDPEELRLQFRLSFVASLSGNLQYINSEILKDMPSKAEWNSIK